MFFKKKEVVYEEKIRSVLYKDNENGGEYFEATPMSLPDETSEEELTYPVDSDSKYTEEELDTKKQLNLRLKTYRIKSKIELAEQTMAIFPYGSKKYKKAEEKKAKLEKSLLKLTSSKEKIKFNAILRKLKITAILHKVKDAKVQKIKNKIAKAEKKLEAIKLLLANDSLSVKERKKLTKKKIKAESKLIKHQDKLERLSYDKGQRSLESTLRYKIKKFRVATIILSLAVVILAAGSVANFYVNKYRINRLYDEVWDLQNDNWDLENKISSLEDEKATLESDIDALETTNADLQTQVDTLSVKANFMDMHIKVVEDDSSRTYHTYGCPYFDDSSFWAYNSKQVINNSRYTKCWYCN